MVQICPDTSIGCITRTYGEGFVAHDCSKGYENCTSVDIERPGVDLIGEHTYSCCKTDKCNTKQLRLPELEQLVNVMLERPQCQMWVPRDYEVNLKALYTKAEELDSGFTLDRSDQRTKWTVGIQPPTASQFLTARDTSSPSCYTVNGQITQGFCGVRYNMKQVSMVDDSVPAN